MTHHGRLRLLALGSTFMLVAAACAGGGGGDGEEPAAGQPQRGGTLVWEREEFGFTNGFDPTGEYLGSAWGIMHNLLLRPLMNYKHVGGQEGNEVVPDLAADMPKVSGDDRTYTFTLKDGVMFGPPVDREVTSKDVLYAFERIGTESLVAQYGFYYDDLIEGLADFKAGKAKQISGIETPNDKTIIFHLTEPTGDFLFRMAMPATAPIPEEVGKCFTKAGEYGRFFISSGPYMIEGSEDLDISSCKAMKPISGYDPTKQLALVRNPNYEQSTDEYRENWIDRWEQVINTNTNDLEQRVITGENDFVYTPTPQTIRKFVTDPELKPRLQVDPGDRTWYLMLNAAEPPFDDIHVRKAANLVMDKDGLRRAWGGPTQGDIATHIVPDVMLQGLLEDYDPHGGLVREDRNHARGEGGGRRLHAHPDRGQGDPDLGASRLGQGLPRSLYLPVGVVRQRQHPLHRKHQLLPCGPDAAEGQGVRHRLQAGPQRRQGHREMRSPAGGGAPPVLGRPRQEDHGGRRPLDPLSGLHRGVGDELRRDQVRVRSVLVGARLVAHRSGWGRAMSPS
jgi:ABC-type transport system substrate-binding protein